MKVVIIAIALTSMAAAALQVPRLEKWMHRPTVRAVVTVEEIPTVVVEATRTGDRNTPQAREDRRDNAE
jgi:hypothetical protein